MIPFSPRLAQAAIVTAVAGAGAVAFQRDAGRNLALHRPVTMSSVLLGEPAAAVNGVVEWGAYAVHSRNGRTTFQIDLQQTAPLDEVRIFGRGDGYHLDSPDPIVVEISSDGQAFIRAAVCPRAVTQVAPCHARIGGASARYVRLLHPSHLVLSEVEVFGAR